MRCQQLMNTEVEYLTDGDTAQQAAAIMRETNLGFLPVCDPWGRVMGTLTDRDLALRVCAEDSVASRTPVTRIMTHEVVACSPEAPISTAEKLMAKHQKSRILIVDEERSLCGVISLADIAGHESNKRVARTYQKVVARERRDGKRRQG